MLVQFMLKNVLSFKEETVLDMTAINAYKEHPGNLIDIGTAEKFLKVAAIYGANASGKSNLHMAMCYFQYIITESFNNVAEDDQTAIARYYNPFSFEEEEENSEFQVIEIIEDYEYKYGFEYNDKCVVAEWMYRKNIKNNRTSTIFERTTHEVHLGASVRKECELYKEQIPAETLVLSFFNKLKLKTDIFRNMYNSIMNTLVVPTDFCEDPKILKALLPPVIDNDRENLLAFLKAIDTGIQILICRE
ncbi:MAG: AAA family ATPase [Clostridia bacterium]